MINNYEEFDLCNVRFRNPNNFIAGSLHNYLVEWEKLSPDKQILERVKNGVDVHQILKHFKGNFKGKHFDSDATVCEGYTKFISKTLEERLTMVL